MEHDDEKPVKVGEEGGSGLGGQLGDLEVPDGFVAYPREKSWRDFLKIDPLKSVLWTLDIGFFIGVMSICNLGLIFSLIPSFLFLRSILSVAIAATLVVIMSLGCVLAVYGSWKAVYQTRIGFLSGFLTFLLVPGFLYAFSLRSREIAFNDEISQVAVVLIAVTAFVTFYGGLRFVFWHAKAAADLRVSVIKPSSMRKGRPRA